LKKTWNLIFKRVESRGTPPKAPSTRKPPLGQGRLSGGRQRRKPTRNVGSVGELEGINYSIECEQIQVYSKTKGRTTSEAMDVWQVLERPSCVRLKKEGSEIILLPSSDQKIRGVIAAQWTDLLGERIKTNFKTLKEKITRSISGESGEENLLNKSFEKILRDLPCRMANKADTEDSFSPEKFPIRLTSLALPGQTLGGGIPALAAAGLVAVQGVSEAAADLRSAVGNLWSSAPKVDLDTPPREIRSKGHRVTSNLRPSAQTASDGMIGLSPMSATAAIGSAQALKSVSPTLGSSVPSWKEALNLASPRAEAPEKAAEQSKILGRPQSSEEVSPIETEVQRLQKRQPRRRVGLTVEPSKVAQLGSQIKKYLSPTLSGTLLLPATHAKLAGFIPTTQTTNLPSRSFLGLGG